MLLKEIVQKTFQGNPTGMARSKNPTAASVCEEMEELEKTVVDCVSRLKARVTEGEAVVASEREHAEQAIEKLKTDVGVLEAKIKETGDAIEKKDAASQRMEQTFTVKIVDLLNEVKKKDASLDSQGTEIKDLKSKLDIQANQIIQLEQALKQTKAEAVSAIKRTEQVTAISTATITTLEGQLKAAREIVREKDSTITGLEQSHTAKIQDLENQIRTQQKNLADRETEVNHLRSEATTLMKGVKEMFSFFKQAEALANNHSEHIVAAVQPQKTNGFESSKQMKTEAKPVRSDFVALGITSNPTVAQLKDGKENPAGFQSIPPTVADPLGATQIISKIDPGRQAETKPAASQPVGLMVPYNPTDASREDIVPRSFFDSITRELSEAFGPMASVILRDHVKAVGESMEKFPRARVAELLDNVSKEIANETVKKTFREHLHKLRLLEKTAA